PEEDLLDLSLFALGATNPEGAVLDLSRCIAKRLVYNKSLFISAVNGINQIVMGYVQNYVYICHFGNLLRFLTVADKTPSALPCGGLPRIIIRQESPHISYVLFFFYTL